MQFTIILPFSLDHLGNEVIDRLVIWTLHVSLDFVGSGFGCDIIKLCLQSHAIAQEPMIQHFRDLQLLDFLLIKKHNRLSPPCFVKLKLPTLLLRKLLQPCKLKLLLLVKVVELNRILCVIQPAANRSNLAIISNMMGTV